ncbi:hypothetical protein ACI65C_006494 [Semiaphis heraclei]
MDSGYWFHKCIFELLKKKSSEMSMEQRRGVILIDEMKVGEAVKFDTKKLKMVGFTDLGEHTTLHQQSKKGDHGLVIIFQPFQGRWVQAIACFLSKGCATGTVLHHLIMECILLLEKSGFFVDAVTRDGASWNRNMWTQFGVTEEKVWVTHPSDIKRQLWFLSDFPHLIKNLRNFIVKHEETWFFGEPIASAMQLLKGFHKGLADCEPTIKFITRIQKLIIAMNSRTPLNALRPNSIHWTAISEFLSYIKQWESMADGKHFMSNNTCSGLKISLTACLEISSFLQINCGYKYVMTSRLNQDALERFFGMMRSACGSNDHPDSVLYIQMFRLISTYSLVKPPKGSNVSGGEMLETLMTLEDVTENVSKKSKMSWEDSMGRILDQGIHCDDLKEMIERTPNNPNDFIITYISGYVRRKAIRFSTCQNCQNSLKFNNFEELNRNKVLEVHSREGLLTTSNGLYDLISTLESVIVKTIEINNLNVDTFFDVASTLENAENLPLIGCIEHCREFTRRILHFYTVTGMHMICKRSNNVIDSIAKDKTRALRKTSKY